MSAVRRRIGNFKALRPSPARANCLCPPLRQEIDPDCCRDINTRRPQTTDNARMQLVPLTESRSTGKRQADATASFDAPLTLLHACHDRVHERCALLQKLWQHMATHGADTQAQEAAANILRYFDVAAPHHHEDEERHVFPVLLASGDARLQQCARTLLQQHQEMAAAWQQVRPLLQEVEQGHTPDLAAHATLIEHFVALYAAHIALEEEVAFPAGFAAMPAAAQAQAGNEMAARRGATRMPAMQAASSPPPGADAD